MDTVYATSNSSNCRLTRSRWPDPFLSPPRWSLQWVKCPVLAAVFTVLELLVATTRGCASLKCRLTLVLLCAGGLYAMTRRCVPREQQRWMTRLCVCVGRPCSVSLLVLLACVLVSATLDLRRPVCWCPSEDTAARIAHENPVGCSGSEA